MPCREASAELRAFRRARRSVVDALHGARVRALVRRRALPLLVGGDDLDEALMTVRAHLGVVAVVTPGRDAVGRVRVMPDEARHEAVEARFDDVLLRLLRPDPGVRAAEIDRCARPGRSW